MSRSGYDEDLDNWTLIKWRGAVASATRGRRGQALLRRMLEALDAMTEKRLIAGELEEGGEVCALGALGRAEGLDMADLDPEEAEEIADAFGAAPALIREITFYNDEFGSVKQTPEQRFARMRTWIARQIKPPCA